MIEDVGFRMSDFRRAGCGWRVGKLAQNCLLFAFSLTPLFAVGGWPMYLYDISHSSFNPSESGIGKHNVASLDVRWAIELAAPMAAAATISDGVAYVGAWDG